MSLSTSLPNEADNLARTECHEERERRNERRHVVYAALSPEWEAELDRLADLHTTAREVDDRLGRLTYILVELRNLADVDIASVVQTWLDKYMPMKQVAEIEKERTKYAYANFILTGEKQ